MANAEHLPHQEPSGLPPQPAPPGSTSDPVAVSELIAAGDLNVVSGDPPVPIAVWRVADAIVGHPAADRLTPRMAALLVGSYTRPGDTVVSVGDDPALAGAAGAGGRTYLHVSDPDHLRDVDWVAGTVALVVLAWPPPGWPGAVARDVLTAMFRTCRRLMRDDGCTIVAVAAIPVGETYEQHAEPLIPAARHAGLGWLQHIVAITAPSPEQHVTWRAGAAETVEPRPDARVTVRLDLLVFAVQRRHRV